MLQLLLLVFIAPSRGQRAELIKVRQMQYTKLGY